jgi:hypothetical protein
MAANDHEPPPEVHALRKDLVDVVNEHAEEVCGEDVVTTLVVVAFVVACQFGSRAEALAALRRHIAVLDSAELRH